MPLKRGLRHTVILSALVFLFLLGLSGVQGASPVQAASGPPEVSPASAFAVSPPLRGTPPLRQEHGPQTLPLRRIPLPGGPAGPDPVLQSTAGPAVSTTAGIGFAGVGNGDYGFTPNAAPPDTNLAVGDTQVVQWVNESFAVFDKATGKLLYGPANGNTLWQSLPSNNGCRVNNDGDPIAQFDKLAHRWVMTQFSVSSPSTYHYLQCVAVSQTGDATGAYNVYSFDYGTTQFNDYPKLSVWPDGYYVTYNIFNNGNTFAGPKACALDRNSMLNGAAATQQCYQLSTSYGSLIPSDLDGSNPPPTGSPNFLLSFGSNSLNLWRFHVDWTSPAGSSLSGPTSIPVASFAAACSGGGTCIPQPGTTQKLDSLADRLMYRLAYRNFGDHESLVVNHSVTAGSSVGIRWYELRNPNSSPSVYQQGTFAPDSDYRWMGSIAMDHMGDIALGYSVSGSVYPSIRYTGQTVGDPLGTLQGETVVKAGGGYQTYFIGGLSRWGDYSAISVDPTDDCTFFYTTEYLKSSGGFNWSTWITSFKFPSCSNAAVTAPAAPSNLAAAAVSSSQINLSWTDNSNNEAGFKIDRSSDGGVTWPSTYSVGAGVTSYQDKGLSASSTYSYRVYAYNSAGNSGYAGPTSATTQSLPAPPSAPSGLTATAASTSQVNLAWTDTSSNEDGFYVERSTDNATFSQVGSVGTNVTTYQDTGLAAATTYYYRVRAYNAGGTSAYSNTASATTQSTPTVPVAPSNLVAKAGASPGQISLTWTDNSNNETGFYVERRRNGAPWSQIGSVGANVTTFNDSGLKSGATYTYRVRAYNSAGNSSYSNTASSTAP